MSARGDLAARIATVSPPGFAGMAELMCLLSCQRSDGIVVGTMGRIFDRLVQHYGEENAFMDLDDIPPGRDFREVLVEAVSKADGLLVGKLVLTWKSAGTSGDPLANQMLAVKLVVDGFNIDGELQTKAT